MDLSLVLVLMIVPVTIVDYSLFFHSQVRIQQLGPGMVSQVQSMCGECRGQGERINPKDRCKTCEGRKVRVRDLHSFGT